MVSQRWATYHACCWELNRAFFRLAGSHATSPVLSHNSARIECSCYREQAVYPLDVCKVYNHYSRFDPFKMTPKKACTNWKRERREEGDIDNSWQKWSKWDEVKFFRAQVSKLQGTSSSWTPFVLMILWWVKWGNIRDAHVLVIGIYVSLLSKGLCRCPLSRN